VKKTIAGCFCATDSVSLRSYRQVADIGNMAQSFELSLTPIFNVAKPPEST
jgi:hypothetical protein